MKQKIAKNRFLLKMRNIHVIYNQVQALKGIDFDLYHGEIHALIGEHRAGKSSLVKILSGAVKKKEGDIIFDGKKINYFTPETATKNGIGMVYQNLNIVPNQNAVENIFAGQMMISKYGFLNYTSMQKKSEDLLSTLNIQIDLKVPIYKLTMVQQYMIELARVLIIDPKLIILDELSNKLTPEEMKNVYRIIYDYKRSGKSIIYITHNMDEILQLADRVTILKDGFRRGTEKVKDLDKFRLFQLTYSFALNQNELEKEEKKFILIKKYIENIIQHLPLGVIILNIDNNVQLINYAAIEILRLSHDVIINKSIKELFSKIDSDVLNDLNNKINNKEEKTWEDVYINDEKLLKINIFPLKDENNIFLGTTILLQDVSMDRYIQNYLIKSEKIASVAEVAVGVAHEINNPLYIIKNYLELIKDEKMNNKLTNKVNDIEKEVDRIVEIVTSLLSFSRIKELPENRVDLVCIIEEVLLLLKHNLIHKKIKFDKKIPLGKVEIIGDENRLKQFFINLINNSIEAVLDEGIIDIQLLLNTEKNAVEIRIIDNGYGIPEDIQYKIFDPFFSTKINKKNTGLGLSICQHIAKEHNGEISFSSIPGKETCFIAKFPACMN